MLTLQEVRALDRSISEVNDILFEIIHKIEHHAITKNSISKRLLIIHNDIDKLEKDLPNTMKVFAQEAWEKVLELLEHLLNSTNLHDLLSELKAVKQILNSISSNLYRLPREPSSKS